MKLTEVRLVAGLLESDADDTGELAKRIIEALDAKRERDDTQWVIVWQADKIVQVVGPYPTENKATKAVAGLSNPGPGESFAGVRQIRSLSSITTDAPIVRLS